MLTTRPLTAADVTFGWHGFFESTKPCSCGELIHWHHTAETRDDLEPTQDTCVRCDPDGWHV